MLSPWRTAGKLLMNTVRLPFCTGPPTCGCGPFDRGQACTSTVARQAGCPPMNTSLLPIVGETGVNGLPWLVRSPTLAAEGMGRPLVDLDRFSAKDAQPCRFDIDGRG